MMFVCADFWIQSTSSGSLTTLHYHTASSCPPLTLFLWRRLVDAAAQAGLFASAAPQAGCLKDGRLADEPASFLRRPECKALPAGRRPLAAQPARQDGKRAPQRAARRWCVSLLGAADRGIYACCSVALQWAHKPALKSCKSTPQKEAVPQKQASKWDANGASRWVGQQTQRAQKERRGRQSGSVASGARCRKCRAQHD